MITTGNNINIEYVARTIRERYGRVSVTVTDADMSPWLLIDVKRLEPHDAAEPAAWHLALWRNTGKVYWIQRDQTVADDPIANWNELLDKPLNAA